MEPKKVLNFTVNFSHLHYNLIEHVCEALSGYFCILKLPRIHRLGFDYNMAVVSWFLDANMAALTSDK